MLKIKHFNELCIAAAAAAILLTAGCQSDTKNSAREDNTATSQNEIAETTRLENTQVNAGARFETTLYAQHFDGAALSSLGTVELDHILADNHSSNPLVIYLAIPESDQTADRRLAVGRYLEDRGGLKPEQIEFREGPNPATYAPAQIGLTNYTKTDTGGSASAGH